MILAAGIVLVLGQSASRALTPAVAMPPITVLALAFRPPGLAAVAPGAGAQGRRHRGGRRSRRRDRDGAGIRPRGGSTKPLRRQGAGRARHGAPGRPASRRGICPGLYYLPSLSIAAVVFFGGRQVIHGDAVDRAVRALRDLAPPARVAARSARLDHGTSPSAPSPRPAGGFAWLEGIEPLPEPADPEARAGRPARPCGSRSVDFAYGGEDERPARASSSSSSPGEIVAICGAHRLRQDVAAQSAAPLLRPDGGARAASAASTRATCRSRSSAASVALVTQRPVAVLVPLRENLTAGRSEDADWDEVLGRVRGRRCRRRSSTGCPTATTR